MSGLSLAGVPLMQTTVMGFAPRSMDEVSSLLKSAYGPDFDLSERASSLSVVAEALNHGDLGRAMIAALQLKLPDLDWEAAANLARAEDRLLKYNEAEPRDWRGWWTTGGGVGPSKPLKPAPSGKPKRPSTASFSIPVSSPGPCGRRRGGWWRTRRPLRGSRCGSDACRGFFGVADGGQSSASGWGKS
jgi:hypothetical protein